MTQQEYDMWCYNQNGGCFNPFITCVLVIALCLLLGSCKTQYVPVETVITEYVNKTDTFIQKDTVKSEKETVIREASYADSAMLAKLGLQLGESQRIILVLRNELKEAKSEKLESHTDTIFRDKEVQVPYPVEKKLTKWQQVCCDYGKIMLGATGISVVALIIFIILWIRKKSI